MASKSVKILLTGLPGCGKTTAVMQIIANLDPKKVAGFYTQEIRQNNMRKGFSPHFSQHQLKKAPFLV